MAISTGLRRRSAARRLCTAVVAVILLSGCGAVSGAGPGQGAGEDGIAETHTGVRFWPLCGNETLEHEGQTWYQLLPAEQEIMDRERRTATGAVPTSVVLAVVVPTVRAPEPDEDLGTLTVYDDGYAEWVSDSGEIWTWLTTTEQSYGWVC